MPGKQKTTDFDDIPAGTMYQNEVPRAQGWQASFNGSDYAGDTDSLYDSEYDSEEEYETEDFHAYGNPYITTLGELKQYIAESGLLDDVRGTAQIQREKLRYDSIQPASQNIMSNALQKEIKREANTRMREASYRPRYNEVMRELDERGIAERVRLATELNALKGLADGLEVAYKTRKTPVENQGLISRGIGFFTGNNQPNPDRIEAIQRIKAVADYYKVNLSAINVSDKWYKVSFDQMQLSSAVNTLKGVMLRELDNIQKTYWWRSADNSDLHQLIGEAKLNELDKDDKLACELAIRRFDKQRAEEVKDIETDKTIKYFEA